MCQRSEREDAVLEDEANIDVILAADVYERFQTPVTPEDIAELIRSLYEPDDDAPLDNPPM